MSTDKNHIEDGLLMLFITAEADDKQIKEVQDWLTLSPDNEAYFEQMQELWLKTADLDPNILHIDINSAWEKVSSLIDNTESDTQNISVKPKTQINSKILKTVYRIAAMVIIGAFIYLLYNISRSQNKLVYMASNESVISDTLSDGSVVALNKNSTLSYPKSFDTKLRQVTLKGEAFFEVKRNFEQAFIISAGESFVKVLGTSFNVKAYADSANVEVTVVSGLVQLYTLNDNSDTISVLLTKDEVGIFNSLNGTVTKVKKENKNDLYWMSKTLIFEKTQLLKVFEILELTFNIEIEVLNPEINEYLFSASFIDNTADEILEVISATYNLKVERENDKFTVSKNEVKDEE